MAHKKNVFVPLQILVIVKGLELNSIYIEGGSLWEGRGQHVTFLLEDGKSLANHLFFSFFLSFFLSLFFFLAELFLAKHLENFNLTYTNRDVYKREKLY